ncbi:hypothetical protein RB195_024039 [Necator americanus]|uniref:Uncharacterized protein n=1 Tax=Necator americanus TaxID=51031 RepID=A0ABR1ENT7_NECAM
MSSWWGGSRNYAQERDAEGRIGANRKQTQEPLLPASQGNSQATENNAVNVPSTRADNRSVIDSHSTTVPSPNALRDRGVMSYNMFNFVDASILSKLELPSFSGNLLEYPEFWARFSILAHDKAQLDNSTKFSLLKSCLHGEAHQSIKGLAVTAANYSIAVDILRTHYDDTTTTRHIMYTQLANLPACHDVRNLQSFYAQMYALVRQYATYYDDGTEFAFGAILLKKLPRCVRSHASSYLSNSTGAIATNPANYDKLTELVARFWDLESAGIMENPGQSDDEEYLKLFRDNYSMTYARLKNSIPSMSRNASYMEKYNAVFKEQLEEGFTEEVPDAEITDPSHYLSHHEELKKESDDIRVRWFCDGSARLEGT